MKSRSCKKYSDINVSIEHMGFFFLHLRVSTNLAYKLLCRICDSLKDFLIIFHQHTVVILVSTFCLSHQSYYHHQLVLVIDNQLPILYLLRHLQVEQVSVIIIKAMF